MPRRILIFIISGSIIGIVGFWAASAQAAVMSVAPQSQTVSLGDTFIATVQVDSEREYINVVQGTIVYPTDLLEAVSVDTGASFLSMWVTPPTIDAASGTIAFLGGKPNGTLVADSPVLRITFRARALGTATVSMNDSDAVIHLNDGNGTRAALSLLTAQWSITNPAPDNLAIESATHPDPDAWYQATTFQATWEKRAGAFYSYEISDQITTIPDDIADEPSDQASFADVGDGIHYFILRERLPRDDWQVVGIRRFQIDATKPLPIDAVVHRDDQSYNGRYVLSFNTYDTTSGVDFYEVVEGNQVVSPATSPYLLTDQSRRDEIVVRALDRAGNTTQTIIASAGAPSVVDSVDMNIILVCGIVLGLAVCILAFAALRRRPS
ncbi:MAG: hypothetical protein HZC01_03425 [Candidatus Kerfeldbacteria bacterium]|nr:hypothetical protein [Candidatus Kerfeldbacteria bacterium]